MCSQINTLENITGNLEDTSGEIRNIFHGYLGIYFSQ